MLPKQQVKSWLTPVARGGLTAKGIVYVLIGTLAFMAAFELGGQSTGDADKEGVIEFIRHRTGGAILLAVITLGLICYAVWRILQGVIDTRDKGRGAKAIGTRSRYVFSGVLYLSLSLLSFRAIIGEREAEGQGSNERVASSLIDYAPSGWLLYVFAAIFAGIGVFQIYFGLSEKFRKYVSERDIDEQAGRILLRSGKIGYVARGIVWLIIGYLIVQAAITKNASEAGDTAEAFRFMKESTPGPYLLGAVGLGLISYGVFNFIRARYEKFA